MKKEDVESGDDFLLQVPVRIPSAREAVELKERIRCADADAYVQGLLINLCGKDAENEEEETALHIVAEGLTIGAHVFS